MASTWGKSWGTTWGNSWGAVEQEIVAPGGIIKNARKRRLREKIDDEKDLRLSVVDRFKPDFASDDDDIMMIIQAFLTVVDNEV